MQSVYISLDREGFFASDENRRLDAIQKSLEAHLNLIYIYNDKNYQIIFGMSCFLRDILYFIDIITAIFMACFSSSWVFCFSNIFLMVYAALFFVLYLPDSSRGRWGLNIADEMAGNHVISISFICLLASYIFSFYLSSLLGQLAFGVRCLEFLMICTTRLSEAAQVARIEKERAFLDP